MTLRSQYFVILIELLYSSKMNYLPYKLFIMHAITFPIQRLLAQCLQYFDLRCLLLMNMSLKEQEKLDVDVSSMLEDELAWLCNFQPSCKRVSDISTDDILLTGMTIRDHVQL